MKKTARIIAAISAMILLFAAILPTAVTANSAAIIPEEMGFSGIVVSGEKTPLRVMHEFLEFNISDFPSSSSDFSLKDYSASVKAEYTINNPTEQTVTTRLLFPFGTKPSYLQLKDYDDSSKYSIKVDGKDTFYVLRHTYTELMESFNLETQLARLSDDYVIRGIMAKDTEVFKYTFTASELPEGVDRAFFEISLPKMKDKAIMVEEYSYCSLEDDELTLTVSAAAGDEIVIYALGKRRQELEDSVWVAYGDSELKSTVDAELEVKSCEETTFFDLVMTSYDEKGAVSKLDWFNAIVESIDAGSAGCGVLLTPLNKFDISDSLMCWYDYSVTVEPDGTVVNTVTAPVYPEINSRYSPRVYHYTYLSTPAKTWSSFGSLVVKINTPYEMVSTSEKNDRDYDNFKKTNEGYEIFYHTLPDYDISFSLSEDDDPTYNPLGNGGSVSPVVITVICIVAGVLAAAAVTVTVFVLKSRKSASKNGKKASKKSHKRKK